MVEKSKELEKIEARRKRHGYADPSRPYGWEDVEYTSIPQATRDLANKGTLRDRRRRPRPVVASTPQHVCMCRRSIRSASTQGACRETHNF